MEVKSINQELGNADLYLIDQILKNRFEKNAKILDAGCGEGRNLTYFIKNGFDIYGIDQDESAIKMIRFFAKNLNSQFDTSKFFVQSIETNTIVDGTFDLVLCFSVLHFADSPRHFFKLINNLTSVVKPGGSLWIGMESDFGMTHDAVDAANGKFFNKKGDVRFLLTEKLINETINKYPLKLKEPVRYHVLPESHSMAYLMFRKV